MGRKGMVRKMTGHFEIIEKEIDIWEMEIQESYRDRDRVYRISLKTNEGPISYKPYRLVNEKKVIQGFKVKLKRKELLTVDELPLKLWELKDRMEKGICKVKLNYCLWIKEIDGKEIPIRFLREEQIEKMEFMEMEEKVN
jgi:hypothetical protein